MGAKSAIPIGTLSGAYGLSGFVVRCCREPIRRRPGEIGSMIVRCMRCVGAGGVFACSALICLLAAVFVWFGLKKTGRTTVHDASRSPRVS